MPKPTFGAVDLQRMGMGIGAMGLAMWLLGHVQELAQPKPCAMAYEWWWD